MERDLSERIAGALAQSGMMRGLASPIQKAMNALLLESPLKPIKDFLNGTWLEHPLHPVLTDVPVGAWTAAILLDLLALVVGIAGLGLASGIAIGLGILGALGAVVTGLTDWMDVDTSELAIGIAHGAINVVATALFVASFLMRWSANWETTWANFSPALAGYLIVSFGAYVGGLLVYRLGIMINRNAFRSGPRKFVPVLKTSELPDNQPRRVHAEGRPVFLLRRGEKVSAIGAVCSHYGGPLEEGKLVDGTIQCPWHYSRFSIRDGSVKAGPATAPVPAYEVRIHNGAIEVRERNAEG